jgi:hypothetical protein
VVGFPHFYLLACFVRVRSLIILISRMSGHSSSRTSLLNPLEGPLSEISTLPSPTADPHVHVAEDPMQMEDLPDEIESDEDWKIKTPIVEIPLQTRGEYM